MKVYAFDVDETLDISGGPIPLSRVAELRDAGHIVGICGNFAVVTLQVPTWASLFSFIGPMAMTKNVFEKGSCGGWGAPWAAAWSGC